MQERWERRPSGVLVLRQRRRGRLIEEASGINLVVDLSQRLLARLLAGDLTAAVTHLGVGIGAAAAAPTDTGLTGEYRRVLLGADYPAPGQVRFSWELDEDEANGLAIREFGLWAADGTLFARRVRAAPIDKDDELRLDGTWTITF